LLIRIKWPTDSRRKVKLKRYLFGDKWIQKVSDSYIVRYFAPRFNVKRIRRGLIWISDEEASHLLDFLNSLGVDYMVEKGDYVYAGPKILIQLGVRAIDSNYFKAFVDDIAIRRARDRIPCLEDALVLTFSRSLRNDISWINYVVMGLLIRRLDVEYMFYRAKLEEVLPTFSEFISFVFRTLSGGTKNIEEITHLVPFFDDIVDYFNSLHPYAHKYIFNSSERFIYLTPKTIASIASKQLMSF